MWPIVQAGAHVEISFDDSQSIRLGDLVAVWRSGLRKTVLHRVVAMIDELIATQGDGTPVIDGWFHRSEVLGVAPGIVVGRYHWRTCPRWLAVFFHRVLLWVLPLVRRSLRGYRHLKRALRAAI